ncbi:MAG: carbonate dehydratase [Proteobacteria bacterium]|nr:carbonate dehydratase [Pseudomonadota bacterium]
MSQNKTPSLAHLLERNRVWSLDLRAHDPDFFHRLAEQQAPKYLWIGCSDSRVPANQIIDMAPGEVFVHRNVANVVVHTDLNCLSAIQFSVDVLKVEHIIVVGHYGCGGVKAVLDGARLGLVDNWLRHVSDVSHKHSVLLNQVSLGHLRHARLCELNVIEQVVNIAHTTIVRDAWERSQNLTVHGWCYSLENGLVNDLGIEIDSHVHIADQYAHALSRIQENLERIA